MAEGTEGTKGLEWLANAKPKEATFKATKRGRQPGTNPMDVHVQSSYDQRTGTDGKVLQLDVPAQSAQRAERLLRRSAARKGYSISVQVWNSDGDVIPLNEIGKLPEGSDVTVVFAASEPTEKEAKADKTESADAAPVDPFAGQPTETEAPKATRKGGKVPAVANP